VTTQGWVELANPSSTKITLKLFSLNNCSSKVSSCKSSSEDLLPNFLEIGEFQLALRTLHNEAAFVAPWNFSFAVIENFLVNSKFCGEDLNGVDKPAVILTQFVDYALFSARPQSALSKKMNASISNKPHCLKSS
jgi:hypothetical protein